MKDGDFPNAVDGEEEELVGPVNLTEDEVPQGLEDGKSHSGHGASCRIRVGAGCPYAWVFQGGVRDRPIPHQVLVGSDRGLRLNQDLGVICAPTGHFFGESVPTIRRNREGGKLSKGNGAGERSKQGAARRVPTQPIRYALDPIQNKRMQT